MFENAITDILVIITTGSLTYLTTTIKRKIKTVQESVDSLAKTVDEHTVVVKDIALCNNVMRKIDSRIRQNFEYINRDDSLAQTFLYLQGDIAKTCIEWAINSNLKVSPDEVIGKYESCSFDIRELLLKFEPEFEAKIRPKLACIYKVHIKKIINITQDDLVNSKIDRFFTLTEQTINEIITTFIRERIIFNTNSDDDGRTK